ncbi:FtsK/SpoIIIE domain-containing protein [Butyrivibrio sp. WCD2001]|uniref:FtsK/SpoIIIE domain-containing protein n=1 Tax=Butyrivibrio sp. WCD2001 TaxID=1280681 RepID=UPI0003FCB70D|nr:FtsK/SpoIIIE domain-containing protein [Butyrivibrio sp. WCD2001]
MSTIKIGYRIIGNSSIAFSFNLEKYPHLLIVGASGSGKSYETTYLLSSLFETDCEVFCLDFKNSGDYDFVDSSHLSYGKDCIDMLDKFYGRFIEIKEKNLSDKIVCVFDEYAAFLIWLTSFDKKLAKKAMDQVAEILMMGRRIGKNGGAYMWTILQKPNAEYFGNARENYFVKIVMGEVSRSIRTMLEIDEVEIPQEHISRTGHGIVMIDDCIYAFIAPTYDVWLMNAMLTAKRKRSWKA